MLKLTQICSGYGSTRVLRGISLDVKDGEIIAVLGRNGVGKTTLMKTIIGLLPLTEGQIQLGDHDITRLPAHQRARQGIGYVPQGRLIFSSLSIKENILTGFHRGTGVNGSQSSSTHGPGSTEESLQWLLDLFPMLQAKLANRGDSLSGGQQQQLAIARALVSQPKVLLLDEPSDGIQPSIVLEIIEQLKSINQNLGTTIVLVEQNLEVVQALAHEVYIMVKGEIIDNLHSDQLGFHNPLLREHLGV